METTSTVKTPKRQKRTPWNRDRAVGQKTPFTLSQAKMIKERLEDKIKRSDKRSPKALRDLALFSTALDTMLRSSDLRPLQVSDVERPDREIRIELFLKQKKTGNVHLVELSEKTRDVLKRWIKVSKKSQGDYLFTGLTHKTRFKPITQQQYASLVKEWAKMIGLDEKSFSTHSTRRTKASLVYERTGNIEAVRQLLGHTSLGSTQHYLNVSKKDALKLAREVEI